MKWHLAARLLAIILLITASAGCTSPAVQLNSPTETTTPPFTVQTSGVSTDNLSAAWISAAPEGSPGAALLEGGKVLMKSIYTYDAGSPDYLPGSYTAQKRNQTDYVTHARARTRVVWPASGKTQTTWVSEPRGVPSGWSGTTVTAGVIDAVHPAVPAEVRTDCSGFVTALFTFASSVTTTKFTGWKAGSPVPLAACFDPSRRCATPNPQNYYHYIETGKNGGFQTVTLAELQPGDIIAYANTRDRDDSGHVMLVAAVSPPDNTGSRSVVVIDETSSPHGSDTRSGRGAGPGIGMGIIRLAPGENGTARFFWSASNTVPQEGPAALGRVL